MARPKLNLTRLEAEVMAAVWAALPEAVRVRDVVDVLNRHRDEPLAYTTVQTMMNILRDKGYLSVDDTAGRAHLYRAQVTQVDASRRLVGDLVDRLFAGRVEPLLQLLVDDPRLDAAELAALRSSIDQRLSDGPPPGTAGADRAPADPPAGPAGSPGHAQKEPPR